MKIKELISINILRTVCSLSKLELNHKENQIISQNEEPMSQRYDILVKNYKIYFDKLNNKFKALPIEIHLDETITKYLKCKKIIHNDYKTKELDTRPNRYTKKIIYSDIYQVLILMSVYVTKELLFNMKYYSNTCLNNEFKIHNLKSLTNIRNHDKCSNIPYHLFSEYFKNSKFEVDSLFLKNRNLKKLELFTKYFFEFKQNNQKFIMICKKDYLEIFGRKDMIGVIYIIETLYYNSASNNTLLIFPELMYFKKFLFKCKKNSFLKKFHFVFSFLIFKLESTLLLFFKKSIKLNQLRVLPIYIVQILKSIQLTGRCFLLLYLKFENNFGEMKRNLENYIEFLGCITLFNINSSESKFNYRKNFIELEYFRENEAYLTLMIL